MFVLLVELKLEEIRQPNMIQQCAFLPKTALVICLSIFEVGCRYNTLKKEWALTNKLIDCLGGCTCTLHDLYPTLNFVIHMINPSAAIKLEYNKVPLRKLLFPKVIAFHPLTLVRMSLCRISSWLIV